MNKKMNKKLNMKHKYHQPTLTPLLAALSLALPVAFTPLAAQAAGAQPDVGTLLQQVQPATPSAPASGATGLTIERADGAKLPPSAPFEVKSIRLSGNTLFDTATLQALVADVPGTTLNLTQLGEVAARITTYCQSHGYPLARALIPAQTI